VRQDKVAAEEQMKQQRAAKKMQRKIRGIQSRAETEEHKPELEARRKVVEEQKAYESKVVLIQKRIRMRQGMARGEEAKGAASLQRTIRQRMAKKELANRRQAKQDGQQRRVRFGLAAEPETKNRGSGAGAASTFFGGGGGSSKSGTAKDTFAKVKGTFQPAKSTKKGGVQSASLPNLRGRM
jgi:hypothetical protein